MSEAYWCCPLTNERPSTLGTEVPAIFQFAAGVVAASLVMAFVSFRPLVRVP